MRLRPILEWSGTAMSFTGTLLISLHVTNGWLFCTVADLVLIPATVMARSWGMLALCAGYAIINIFGWLSWVHHA